MASSFGSKVVSSRPSPVGLTAIAFSHGYDFENCDGKTGDNGGNRAAAGSENAVVSSCVSLRVNSVRSVSSCSNFSPVPIMLDQKPGEHHAAWHRLRSMDEIGVIVALL